MLGFPLSQKIYVDLCYKPRELIFLLFFWNPSSNAELFLNITGSCDLDYVNINCIPTHCGVDFECVHSLARTYVIRYVLINSKCFTCFVFSDKRAHWTSNS